jgi:UDP-N-acetylglucosamine/UDP-N-acetylgalactosamine diphosphorylase
MAQPLTDRYAAARETLAAVGQDHVFHYWPQLDEVSKDRLLSQIQSIDWPEVGRLIKDYVFHKPELKLPEDVEPAPWYPYDPRDDQEAAYDAAAAHGEDLIRRGKVAAFCVAGGQGTRLGWKGPKGTYPATPITSKPLFEVFTDYLHNVQQRYHTVVPFYVMTSPVNHADTVAFFEENDHFGLNPKDVMFFPQGMMPAIDMNTGKVLLAASDELALSPNGHGGSLKALWTSGAIADMRDRGIEQISYIQVDNPNVRVVDPLFIGLHAKASAQMSSKMLPKRDPLEKLGNLCLVDGKMTVIEYSDLPDELAYETVETGELRFRAGSIALHVIAVDFVEQLNNTPAGFRLPFHRAEKKVGYMDLETDRYVEPATANAVKLETFVFDALPMTEASIVYETDRVEEFCPIKNADAPGALDTAGTSKTLQMERAARWLTQQGVSIPRNAAGDIDGRLEISQRLAIYPTDLDAVDLPDSMTPGSDLLIQ